MSTKKVFLILGTVLLLSTSSALYIYLIGGVYKDFPMIGLTQADVKEQGYNFFSGTDNIHIHYNEKIRKLDQAFAESDQRKVLVIGNSYGRDVANIFLESTIASNLDLTYFDKRRVLTDKSIVERWNKSDLVVIASNGFFDESWIIEIGNTFNFPIDVNKVFVFGTKDYGHSNGIHYNKMSSISDLSNFYASMRENTLEVESQLQKEWGSKYISLISPIVNQDGQVRIFDNERRFISQDTYHLTKAGAQFYAKLLEKKILAILNR